MKDKIEALIEYTRGKYCECIEGGNIELCDCCNRLKTFIKWVGKGDWDIHEFVDLVKMVPRLKRLVDDQNEMGLLLEKIRKLHCVCHEDKKNVHIHQTFQGQFYLFQGDICFNCEKLDELLEEET